MKPLLLFGDEVNEQLPVNSVDVDVLNNLDFLEMSNTENIFGDVLPVTINNIELLPKKRVRRFVKFLQQTSRDVIMTTDDIGKVDSRIKYICKIEKAGKYINRFFSRLDVFFVKGDEREKLKKLSKVNLGFLMRWLAQTNNIEVINILNNISDKIYKSNSMFLYSYLLFSLPSFKPPRVTSRRSEKSAQTSLFKRFCEVYKFSRREGKIFFPNFKKFCRDEIEQMGFVVKKEKRQMKASTLGDW